MKLVAFACIALLGPYHATGRHVTFGYHKPTTAAPTTCDTLELDQKNITSNPAKAQEFDACIIDLDCIGTDACKNANVTLTVRDTANLNFAGGRPVRKPDPRVARLMTSSPLLAAAEVLEPGSRAFAQATTRAKKPRSPWWATPT